ncbi:hypothetical protein SEA_CONFIDENCE_33 [Gordonia phage Confidence]|nr:hypothetical protein SEA_CONFIDENCE_33 [Gordonia phage Confidence]
MVYQFRAGASSWGSEGGFSLFPQWPVAVRGELCMFLNLTRSELVR